MKNTLLFTLIFISGTSLYAQWNNTANNYSIGMLGLGIEMPKTKLHIQNTSTDFTWIPIGGTCGIFESAWQNRSFLTIVGKSVAQSELWFGDENSQNSGRVRYNHPTDALEFWANATPKMVIDKFGKIGIGTMNPKVSLHIQNYSTNFTWTPSSGTVGIFESSYGNRSFLTIVGKSVAQSELWFGDENSQNSGRVRYNHPTDALEFWSNEISRMIIDNNGNVGIGTPTPDAKLAVNGTIHAKEVQVDLIGWPDYVFEEGYNLKSLKEVEEFLTANKHLPEIPSEKEVKENGIRLGEMNAILLQKIEELTLYLIEQNKQNELQQQEIELLKKKILD